MASGRLIDYLGSGTAASRPASPSLISGSIGAYYSTDTGDFSVYDGSSWHSITSASSGTISLVSKSAAYTFALGDVGILHPAADTTARTFTIPANSSVAFPVGTTLTVINQNAAGTITIAITTDTMRLAGAGTTGSRTLAANGIATAVKITSTEWIINGTGLT